MQKYFLKVENLKDNEISYLKRANKRNFTVVYSLNEARLFTFKGLIKQLVKIEALGEYPYYNFTIISKEG